MLRLHGLLLHHFLTPGFHHFRVLGLLHDQMHPGQRILLSDHRIRLRRGCVPLQPILRWRFILLRHPRARFTPVGHRHYLELHFRLHQLRLGRVNPAPRVTGFGSWFHVVALTIRFALLGRVLLLLTQFQILLLFRVTQARTRRPTQIHPDHPASTQPAPTLSLLREPHRNHCGSGSGPHCTRAPSIQPEHWRRNNHRLGHGHNPVRRTHLQRNPGRVQEASEGSVFDAGSIRHVLRRRQRAAGSVGEVAFHGVRLDVADGEQLDTQQLRVACVPGNGVGAQQRELGFECDSQLAAAEP